MRSVKEDLKSNSTNVRPINIDVAMKTEERTMLATLEESEEVLRIEVAAINPEKTKKRSKTAKHNR